MITHENCSPSDHEKRIDTFWLAFSRPNCESIGVIIVDAKSNEEAAYKAARIVAAQQIEALMEDDIMVMSVQMTSCGINTMEIATFGRNRLIPPAELEAHGVPASICDEHGNMIATLAKA